ncbi:flavodoxin [uncultured Alistipes sp.]|uniref:flavodoxin n=1 Tax=uncultured Alistipes sp. TaxID=538949 RepID=UPI00260A875A|nr:flavodoxin [uncultured Alistipes sp.]
MRSSMARTGATLVALLLVVSLPAYTHAQNTLVKERDINTKKILVAFFSRTGENYAVGHIEQGNTHIVAEMIASATGGTLFRIEPATPYPDDYRACTEVAQREKRSKARPALVGDIAAEEFDVIFLGYPNWWGDLPMCIYTFLEQHDWQGKVVIPFCTHEGSGLSDTENRLRTACRGASVLNGLAVRGFVAQNEREKARKLVLEWLKQLKY